MTLYDMHQLARHYKDFSEFEMFIKQAIVNQPSTVYVEGRVEVRFLLFDE